MKNSDALEIEVTNFGPIVEANVDLRPFTLFVGPSNTGKSYLAIMIYALHRLFSGALTSAASWRRSMFGRHLPQIWKHQPTDQVPLSDDDVQNLIDWAEQVSTTAKAVTTPENLPNQLPEQISAIIRPLLNPISDSANIAEDEIVRCFGLQSPAQLVRHSSRTTKSQVVLRRYDQAKREQEAPFSYQLHIPRQGPVNLTSSISSKKPLYYRHDAIKPLMEAFQSPIPKDARKHLVLMVVDNLLNAVFPYIVGPVNLPAYYLPAGRTGVMHAHRTVVSALVEPATSAEPHSVAPMRLLSGVLADFLELLSILGDFAPDRRRRRVDVAAHIEKTLLGGTVHHEKTTRQEEYPSFAFRPDGWNDSLPLMCTSSMVSELAPVVLYLRHVVREGDVLIIEEPESHLHPEMQVEFTRLLATAVRSGIRIIMTTHSEWVLEELANLVQASELTKTQRKEINGSDIALNENEVGAWLFQPKKRPKGSVVKEIPLNRESGTFAAGYDKVAVDVYNRWAELSSQANKSEGK